MNARMASGVAEPYEIRRRASLVVAAVVIPLSLAIVYGWYALSHSNVIAWLMAGLLSAIGAVALTGLSNLRSPVFVADEHGVRLREGKRWVGLLWEEMDDIHLIARSGLRDPHLLVFGAGGTRVHSVAVGFVTDADPDEVREELARRWTAHPY